MCGEFNVREGVRMHFVGFIQLVGILVFETNFSTKKTLNLVSNAVVTKTHNFVYRGNRD